MIEIDIEVKTKQRLELTEDQARDIMIVYLQETVLGIGNFVRGKKLCTKVDDHVVELAEATDLQRVAEVALKMCLGD